MAPSDPLATPMLEKPCAGVANGLLETPRTQLKKQAKMTEH